MSEEIRFDETIAEQETQEATAAFGDSANIEVPVFGGLSPTEESQAAGAQPEAPVFEGMSDSEQDMGHQIPETLEDSAQTEVPVYEKSYSDALESVLQEAAASETVLAPEAPLRSEEPQYAASADSQAAGYEDNTGEVLPSAQETFEEMLEKSIKTLHTGEKVTGIVTSITSTEVSVDLGTKQSGYIPISEFTDNTNMKIEDVIKIGDSIETFVMRVNDVEGMVMLSKKRLDAIKNWDDIEAAKESKAVVEGIITEENKGGVVVSVKGVRVFVPASQTGLPKSAPMSDLMKKTVRLRITEVNQSRRRVVGSIRAVLSEERREKSDQLWNDIEVNKQYSGVVKSMTSYGVFVDIGGVDGMIHISELSWTRIKQPSEVMSIGDEVSVYVLSFDKDNRKISLGYKKNEDNPWMRFISQNAVGDIVNVKIVKMMPFGAFAEICPGVDGLIHISQITDHRIGLPSEVLSDGQLVDVKITEIDKDRRKVSLSIRALIDPSSQPITEKEALDAAVSDKTPVVVYDTEAPPATESDGGEPEAAPDLADALGAAVETEAPTEPEIDIEPETAAEPETDIEPEAAAEQETDIEPEAEAAPEETDTAEETAPTSPIPVDETE